MEELRRWNSSHLCSAEECGNRYAQGDQKYCLSTQMLARFPVQDLRVAHDHGSWLWSFDKQVLGHGPPLGSGSFGAVSEVTWLGCKLAQKVFNPAGLHSLRAEADALVRMNHPHIVKVFAHSEDSLLMDAMCTDLQKFMKMRRRTRPSTIRPFSLAAAIDLMLQIADAVSHMHSRNLAHRDLKSSNILVNPLNMAGLDGDDDDDGFVFAKIADFGMAKVKREITRNSHLTHNVGTRKWMAPEIFGANLDDDPWEAAFPMKADVYSFGIICYEILSGEEPYSDVLISELYAKLTAPFPLRPQLPASCPTGLVSLICACWDADPQKRPAFANVCRVLRYLKCLPTLTDLGGSWSIDGEWPYGRLIAKEKTQIFYEDRGYGNPLFWLKRPGVEDIKGFRVDFSDCNKRVLSTFRFAFDTFMRASDSESTGCTVWIYFNKPSEFLVQVEGSLQQSADPFIGEVVSTVTFITTTQRYGPFGTACKGDERFCTDSGRVVGATPMLGWSRKTLKCCVIPEIVRCLQYYLEDEDPFT